MTISDLPCFWKTEIRKFKASVLFPLAFCSWFIFDIKLRVCIRQRHQRWRAVVFRGVVENSSDMRRCFNHTDLYTVVKTIPFLIALNKVIESLYSWAAATTAIKSLWCSNKETDALTGIWQTADEIFETYKKKAIASFVILSLAWAFNRTIR